MQLRRFHRLCLPAFEQASSSVLKRLKCRTRPFDTLVLSGGGIKGIAMLGAMEYMFTHNIAREVNHFIGTSVGALVATIMAMGANPREVFERHVLPFKYSPDVDITRLERNFGLDSGKNLEKFIDEIVPDNLTFLDLYETYNRSLTICATNLNTHSAEYFSKETTPHLPVKRALRMSCSVPLYFSAVRHNGSLYVDGGVACNFPVHYAIETGGKRILGVRFAAPEKHPNHQWTLDSFLGALLESNINRRHSAHATVIKLETGDVTQPLHFKLARHEKRALYDLGYAQTEMFFKKHV